MEHERLGDLFQLLHFLEGGKRRGEHDPLMAPDFT
jgi:hypothetical protein